MHLNAKRPVFMPRQYWAEIEKLSKATLMDMVWDFAKQCTPPDDGGNEAPDSDVIGTVRSIAAVVKLHR
jgi:hypothetical protein